MALSPQERTWNQLQENLNRKRQSYQQSQDSQAKLYGRYRRTPPSPVLPRLADSPVEAPLRGSHYPVIPPVANEKYHNDETLSLVSYSSELGQLEDDNDDEDGHEGIPFSSSPDPYPHHHHHHQHQPHQQQGGAQRGKPPRAPPPQGGWNASTHVRHEKTPYMQRGAENGRRPAKPQGAGRAQGAGHAHRGRPVWRHPDEGEDEELEDESALTVQRHYRGYKTRKNLDMLNHLENPSFSLSFMHHFLKDVLQNDILLDVACEALVEERTKKSRSREAKNEVTTGMSKRLSMSFDLSPDQSFWTEALTRPEIHRPVASSLIKELVYEETRAVISEGIDELLDDYFESKAVGEATNVLVTELVQEMMPDLVVDSTWDVVAESVVDLLVDEETAFCVGWVLQETIIRGAVPLDEQEEQKEIKEVSKVAEGALLETAILDHLLAMVVRSGQVWSETEEADHFLDNWLSDILFRQYAGILHARKATEECVPLKRQHEVVVTDVAIDCILTELAEELEEDLKDLDETEMGMDLQHL